MKGADSNHLRCSNPACNTLLKINPAMAGKRVACPRCKQATVVPEPEIPMAEVILDAEPVPDSEPAAPPAPAARAAQSLPVPATPASLAPPVTAVLPLASSAPASAAPAPAPAPVPAPIAAPQPAAAAQASSDAVQKAPRPAPAATRAGTGARTFRQVQAWIDWITQPRPKVRTAVRYTFMLSLALHATAISLTPDGGLSPEQLKTLETEYGKKINATKSASVVAKDLASKLTMPPPPPDPEAVAEKTLTDSLTSDVTKVTAGLLDVKLQEELVSHVKRSLKDELAAAGKDIAEGKLSQQEIEKLHQKFKQRAHVEAKTWQTTQRETKQVDIVKLGISEWFESRVAKVLQDKIRFELFQREHGAAWHTYNGSHWGFVHLWYGDCANFGPKIQSLRGLLQGRFGYPTERFEDYASYGCKKLEHNGIQLPDWPKASAKQADVVAILARRRYEGWDDTLAHYLRLYHPHRAPEMKVHAEKTAALWKKAIQEAEAYQAAGESGAAETGLQSAQSAFLNTLKEINEITGKMLVGNAGDYAIVNQAVRSRVLRGPEREKLYKHFVDRLVTTLEPTIRGVAEGQFREGIIIRKEGIDNTTREFTEMVIMLLRKVIEGAFPKSRFESIVFTTGCNPYKSSVTGANAPPTEEQIKKDEEALDAVLAKWSDADKAYVEKRGEGIVAECKQALDATMQALLSRVVSEGTLWKEFFYAAESVDYTDKVDEKLDARARALQGRGQDLATLTADGVPDTSAPLVALMFSAGKGAGVNLEPVLTSMQPGYITRGLSATALRTVVPQYPPPAAKWGYETQVEIKPKFQTPRAEGIPFLSNFPRLDGDLSDWGKIRPLVLKKFREGPAEPIAVLAAWNYQGFFFGYQTNEEESRFVRPTESSGMMAAVWPYVGDYFRVGFDTLDARNANRGEPHTQEFVIFPQGDTNNETSPGVERVIESQRNAVASKNIHGAIKARFKKFESQSPKGPDGSGPYRVTKVEKNRYTVEVFIPRSMFSTPVFSPGWYVGFECAVATGLQRRAEVCPYFFGQGWAGYHAGIAGFSDSPTLWGDLLLLGTDARLSVQNADEAGAVAQGVVPGHSYLVTIKDPDRNVNLSAEDTVLVSAEVAGGSNNDVEIFILKETGPNTSTFRGYINTQPGKGREVQGALEVMAGQQVRFGYVDFANSRGERNVVYELKLPVVSPFMGLVAKRTEE